MKRKTVVLLSVCMVLTFSNLVVYAEEGTDMAVEQQTDTVMQTEVGVLEESVLEVPENHSGETENTEKTTDSETDEEDISEVPEMNENETETVTDSVVDENKNPEEVPKTGETQDTAAEQQETVPAETAETVTSPTPEAEILPTPAADAPVVLDMIPRSVTYTQQVIDGKKYLVGDDGSHYTGWYDMTSSWRLYFNPDDNGAAAVGVTTINGNAYLFDNNGILIRTAGTPVVNGQKYWVTSDATLRNGWQKLGSWWMYFDPDTYVAQTGLIIVGDERYILDNNGVMQAAAGTPIINGKKYWFNENGSLRTGWQRLGSWWMYFDPETCEARIELTEIDGKRYIFDDNGVMQAAAGTPVINGKKYWFNSDGSLRTGWQRLGSWWMYFDPETCEGQTGLTEIDGKRYLFDSNGVMYDSTGTPVINGKKYWINSDGSLRTGWQKLGNIWMYFDPQTCEGAVSTLREIDGETYYFDSNGTMATGKVRIGDYEYTFDDSGAMTGREAVSRAVIYAEETLDSIGWNLRAAFNWSAGIHYYDNDNTPPAGYSFEEYNAIYGFENYRGDCQPMAATFYYMARALGYDVHMVRGYVPLARGGMGPHSWCEIVMNGTVYVFDPNFTNETGRNGYQITYGTSGTWRYTDYARIN